MQYLDAFSSKLEKTLINKFMLWNKSYRTRREENIRVKTQRDNLLKCIYWPKRLITSHTPVLNAPTWVDVLWEQFVSILFDISIAHLKCDNIQF